MNISISIIEQTTRVLNNRVMERDPNEGRNSKTIPPKVDLETKKVLRQLTRSHRALAELKGYADTMPNKNVLINAVTVNEAKDNDPYWKTML